MKCELGSTNSSFNRVTMYVTMKGELVSINNFYLQYLSFNTGFFLCFFFHGFWRILDDLIPQLHYHSAH